MLTEAVTDGFASTIALSTEDYQVKNISLDFNLQGYRVEYVFRCDVEFYIMMFGQSYPVITRQVELTGYHNKKF